MRETIDDVHKRGRERLYPSLTNPNWLVLRARREIFRKWVTGFSLPGASVLDVGGRIQPYRPLIGDEGLHYVAIDLRATPLVDVIADAASLPFAKERFEIVICTQVLELVPEPSHVISEIHRVLKPGGMLLLSVPALYPIDAAEDRWRFLPAGIARLTSSFSKVEIVAEGGSITGFCRTVNLFFYMFARPSALKSLCALTIVPALNLLGLGLEKMIGSRNKAFTANYSVLAQK